MPEFFGQASLSDLSDHDPSRNDCQVSCQRRLPTEAFKNGHVVGEQGDKDLGAEVVDVVRDELSAAGLGGVIDDVDEQSDESVYKVFPRTRLFGQATLQQTSIDFGKGHGRCTHNWQRVNGLGFLASIVASPETSPNFKPATGLGQYESRHAAWAAMINRCPDYQDYESARRSD